MREYKFRGKTFSGEWVYGLLSHMPEDHEQIEAGYYISNAAGMPFAHAVKPETIGQYTGRKDKKGLKEIYEGDVVNYDGKLFIVKFGEWDPGRGDHVPSAYGYYLFPISEESKFWDEDCLYDNTVEIIGNIHYNPDFKE
jgi:hypothetical protein